MCEASFPTGTVGPPLDTNDGLYLYHIPVPARRNDKQVAQWATIAHHGASIMFGDTIIYDAQRQITLNLKQ